MKRMIYFFGLIILFTSVNKAQWVKNVNSNDASAGFNIAVDNSGNSYVIGKFSGTADFDPGVDTVNLTSAGSLDIFITKYNPNGDLIWAKRVGGISNDQGFCIAVNRGGNLYVGGFFSDTVDFDPGTGVFNLISDTARSAFLAKYDTDGNLIWADKIGGGANEHINLLELDESGNVYVTGGFQGITDFDPGVGTTNLISTGSTDAFFAKYDTNGNLVWAKKIDGASYNESTSIALDKKDNVYITGGFSGTADFDPGTGISNLTSAGSFDIYFAKYDSTGSLIWAKGIGGVSVDFAQSITTDDSGNVYLTGIYSQTADFDPGTGTAELADTNGSNAFFAKYDTGGNYLWAKSFQGGWAMGDCIIVDNAENIFVSGQIKDTVDLNPGPGVAEHISKGGGDIFMAKYNSNGDFEWANCFGDSSGDEGIDLETDKQGNLYMTGYFAGTVNFNAGLDTVSLTGTGTQTAFVLKYSTNVLGVELNKSTLPAGFSLSQNYPNPFNPSTTINYSIPRGQFVTLKVYDLLGKEVATLVNEEQKAGSYKVNFNASRFTSGVYFYRLQAGNFLETKKFILLK